MKKKYTAPEAEIVLFETEKTVMYDPDQSFPDPWASARNLFRLNELPNGTILDEHGMPTNIPR